MSGTLFTSNKNYLKRDPTSGSTEIPGPTAVAAWFNYATEYPIEHNLGYVPLVRVYYEPFKDGKIYQATGRRLSGLGPGLAYGDTMCFFEITSTTLTISLERALAPDSDNYPIYWVIYRDSE